MFNNGIKQMSLAVAITLCSASSLPLLSEQVHSISACNCSSQADQQNTQQLPQGACESKAANQSWLAWLTGNSRSSQFHFLDLLELLESGSSKTKSSYTSLR